MGKVKVSDVIATIKKEIGNHPQLFEQLRLLAQDKPLKPPGHVYERKEITDNLPYILNNIGDYDYDFNGDMIHMDSLRYKVFRKSITCAKCGIIGKFFAKERCIDNKPSNTDEFKRWHWNLYALDENNKEVLMTKDHIYPKSLGGSNDLDNLQTMCIRCNIKKSNKIEN